MDAGYIGMYESSIFRELKITNHDGVLATPYHIAGSLSGITPGYIRVNGTYLHWIDGLGDERRAEGILDGVTGKDPGYIAIIGRVLRYIDGNGDERYLPNWVTKKSYGYGTGDVGNTGGTSEPYTDVHNAANGDDLDKVSSAYSYSMSVQAVNSYSSATLRYTVVRAFMDFSTAEIDAAWTIHSASIVCTGVTDNSEVDAGQADLHIVEGVQDDPLAALDEYGNHLSKTTSWGSIAFADIPTSVGVLYEIPLNATGISNINRSGYTKFCLRLSGDIDSSEPTGSNRVSTIINYTGVNVHYLEYPYLKIIYS